MSKEQKATFKKLGTSGGEIKSGSFAKKAKRSALMGDTASRNAPHAKHHQTNKSARRKGY